MGHIALLALAALCSAAAGCAQTLRLEAQPVRAGGTGAATLRLEEPASSKAVTALQWDLLLPGGVVTLEAKDVVAGEAARSAGKALACSAKTQGERVSTFRCILAGGVQGIPGGAVASLKFGVAPNAAPGEYPLRLEKVLGTDAKANPVRVSSQAAHLIVTR